MRPVGANVASARARCTGAPRRKRVQVALLVVGLAASALNTVPVALGAQRIVVRAGSAVPTLTAALARATPGATIVVTAGNYAEPTIRVTVPRITIVGEGWPTFDGEGAHEVLIIRADSVTVRGITFMNTGVTR